MCRPLAVECHGRLKDCRDEGAHHRVVLKHLIIPCKKQGTKDCKDGSAESIDFQVARTTCNGIDYGHSVSSGEGYRLCRKALVEYGEKVHAMNMQNKPKESEGGWFGWLRG